MESIRELLSKIVRPCEILSDTCIRGANYHIRFLLPALFVENANLNYPRPDVIRRFRFDDDGKFSRWKKDKTVVRFFSISRLRYDSFLMVVVKLESSRRFLMFPGTRSFFPAELFTMCHKCGQCWRKCDISSCASPFINLDDQWYCSMMLITSY